MYAFSFPVPTYVKQYDTKKKDVVCSHSHLIHFSVGADASQESLFAVKLEKTPSITPKAPTPTNA